MGGGGEDTKRLGVREGGTNVKERANWKTMQTEGPILKASTEAFRLYPGSRKGCRQSDQVIG